VAGARYCQPAPVLHLQQERRRIRVQLPHAVRVPR
jgi:hypothetical protein